MIGVNAYFHDECETGVVNGPFPAQAHIHSCNAFQYNIELLFSRGFP